MTDKQIIIDENKINPNDWLEPYKPIPACEVKDCNYLVYAGNDVYGCRIAEDGLVCDDFNNDDECCMYRQLEYYKEALKAKEQECEELRKIIDEAKNSKLDLNSFFAIEAIVGEYQLELDQLKAENDLFRTCHDNEQAKRRKFEQCLAEIKEIAERCIKQDICTTCDNSDKCHMEDEEIPTYDVCKLILQKISEVEE